MATQENVTPRQLDLARKALWHQNGDALRTFDSVREWIDEAGLVPFYPHAQFAVPAPSFAEAVLGRPENGWVPKAANTQAAAAQDESEEEELDEEDDLEDSFEDDDESQEDDDNDDEDENEPETGEGDEAMLSGDGNIPGDRETMLSDDDEFAEDEGDEIAEEDSIHAQGDPVPNDLREGGQEAPAAQPVNGFSAEERETVHRALARLVEDGSVVPLNLLGTATGEPDYVVSASAFSFIYTLRGDKNWKSEPATTGPTRVSPLAVKVYNLLHEHGGMAPHELSAKLGNGITDSATLRALSELWAIQRVLPLPDAEGRPAKWEVTTARFLRHMKAGANAGQPTALSALLSLYLAQAIAATSDEMEIFLSPLAARSRVREVVHGLSASRQLEPLVVEGKTLLHITGTPLDLPEDDSEAVEFRPQRSRYEVDDRRAEMNERPAREAARAEEGGDAPRAGYGERKGPPRGERRPAGRFGDRRPAFGGGDHPAFNRGGRSAFSPRSGGAAAGGYDRERRPFQRRDEQGGGERSQGGFERPSFTRPWDEERGGDRPSRPFAPREGGDRRGFGQRSGGFAPREGGDRRPFNRGDRPFQPREAGDRRPFAPRGDRPFTPREGGDRRPFSPRGERPFPPREGGDRRPFQPREGGEGRSFAPRGDRPFQSREGGDRRPFTPRGDRPFTPREGGDRRPFSPRGDRPFTPREGGEGRSGGFGRSPFGGGSGAPRRPFGDRPQRDRFSGESGEGRPSFQSGAHSAGPGGSKFGGSGFGRDRGGKPAGFGRPGGKPSFRGPGRGPARGGAPKRRPE